MAVPMISNPISTSSSSHVFPKQNYTRLKLPQMNGLIDQVLKPDSSLPQQSDINFIFSIDIDTLDLPLRNKLMQARIVIDRKVALNIARESQPDLSDSQVIESQKNQLEIFERSHRASKALSSVATSTVEVSSSDKYIPPCPATSSPVKQPPCPAVRSDSKPPIVIHETSSKALELKNNLDLLHQIIETNPADPIVGELKTNISRLLGFTPGDRQSVGLTSSRSIFHSLSHPEGFIRVETLGDGNCFLNSFSLLLLDFGTNNLDRQGVILSILNNDAAKQGDDLNLTIALFTNRQISSSDKQRLITKRLKRLLKHHVEQNFDVSQGASHEMKSRLFKLRLTYNDFRSSNEDIKRRYLHEIERNRQWLGMESMDFVMDMFGRYNLHFNGDGCANAVSVFSSNATQNDRRLSYGLSNPYGAHWTLLKRT